MSSEPYVRLVSERLAEAVKSKGFRKEGKNSFVRHKNDVIDFINLQRSQRSTGDWTTLTVNVGIYSLNIAAKRGEFHPPPEIWTCHWQQRIGLFLPQPSDKWWEVCDRETAIKAANEIYELLNTNVLPTMDELSSTARLKALWLTGQSPGITDSERQEYLQLLKDLS